MPALGGPTRPRAGALCAALLATLILAMPAAAERSQRGHLIVAVNGGVSPRQLPRDHAAPVALQIGGRIETDDGSPLPRMTRVRLAIAGRGVLDTRGLAVCPRARLRNASTAQALRHCGPALVGRGRLEADAFVANQKPFPIEASLLAFNGRTASGAAAVWVHAFAANPPLAIVLPFVVARHGDRVGTVLSPRVPPALGNLPHLASFQLRLFRPVFPLPIAPPLRASSTGRDAAMKLSTKTLPDRDRFALTRPATTGGSSVSLGGEIRAPDTWTG